MNSALLKVATNNHSQLRERLKQQFALDDDDPALIDTLEGISDFKEICLATLREAKRRGAMAEAMKAIIQDNQARKARHEQAETALRAIVCNAMQEAGERKLEAPDITASLGASRRKLIIDEERLPTSFTKQLIKLVPDREKIEAAIGEGDVPVGVEISNNEPMLTIRMK